jgi:hypothetical protein
MAEVYLDVLLASTQLTMCQKPGLAELDVQPDWEARWMARLGLAPREEQPLYKGHSVLCLWLICTDNSMTGDIWRVWL